MLRARIIPCLLLKGKGLVKTVKFNEPKYVGDPINVVRIFNEKQVDELMVLDIDATTAGRPPNLQLIQHLAAECRMPLCYGGGIRSLESAKQIFGLGVEKIAISAGAIEQPSLISTIATQVGNQSVIAVLDVKKRRSPESYEVFTHNGTRGTKCDPVSLAKQFESSGAGEIVINAIDRDGTMSGYDLELVEMVRQAVSVPITILGGAGSLLHITDLIKRYQIIGAGAGSLFVFKGIYRAVLVNYPTERQKLDICRHAPST